MKVHPTARILLSLVAASVMGSSMVGCRSSETAPSSPEPSSERTLASGKVVGFRAENGALAWFGIPFAAAPVDALRWRAPRPPSPWPGVLEATQAGETEKVEALCAMNFRLIELWNLHADMEYAMAACYEDEVEKFDFLPPRKGEKLKPPRLCSSAEFGALKNFIDTRKKMQSLLAEKS